MKRSSSFVAAGAVCGLVVGCPPGLDDPERFCADLGADRRCVASSLPDDAQLVIEDDFEDGNTDGWGVEAAEADDIQVSGGAVCFALEKDDPLWEGAKVAALKFSDSDFLATAHVFEFDLAIPTDYAFDPVAEVIVVFVGNREGSWLYPSLRMSLDEGEFELQLAWYANADTSQEPPKEQLWAEAYVPGSTTRWRLQLRFSTGADGLIRIWRNDQLVVDRAGQNDDGLKDSLMFKFGIEKWGWPNGQPSTTTRRDLCFDNVRIWRLPGS